MNLDALPSLVARALAAERALDELADDADPDPAARADTEARAAVIHAMTDPSDRADADRAVVLPTGTVLATCAQADGLSIVPPERVARLGLAVVPAVIVEAGDILDGSDPSPVRRAMLVQFATEADLYRALVGAPIVAVFAPGAERIDDK